MRHRFRVGGIDLRSFGRGITTGGIRPGRTLKIRPRSWTLGREKSRVKVVVQVTSLIVRNGEGYMDHRGRDNLIAKGGRSVAKEATMCIVPF